MILKNINEKLSDEQKSVFQFEEEKAELVYAEIPNIDALKNQYTAAQLIHNTTYKDVSEKASSLGDNILVYDRNLSQYTIMQQPLSIMDFTDNLKSQMNYDSIKVNIIAGKAADCLEDNSQSFSQSIDVKHIESNNIELHSVSYAINKYDVFLMAEKDGNIPFIAFDKNTPRKDIENNIMEKLKIKDPAAVAELINKLDDMEAVMPCTKLKTPDKDYSVDMTTSTHISISNGDKTVYIPKDNVNSEKLAESFGLDGEKAKKLSDGLNKSIKNNKSINPSKQNLNTIINNVKSKNAEKSKTEKSAAEKSEEKSAENINRWAGMGGGIFAVIAAVICIVVVASSATGMAFPFHLKETDEGKIVKADTSERIAEYKTKMDELVNETNSLISNMLTLSYADDINNAAESGVNIYDEMEYQRKLMEWQIFGDWYDYDTGGFITDMPLPPGVDPAFEESIEDGGHYCSPRYMGARWFGSNVSTDSAETLDDGATEATSVPYGVLYDEMLCTLATYYVKLVSNPAPGKTREKDFHIMNEYDIYGFYNSLPFWSLEIWQDTLSCSGCCTYFETVMTSITDYDDDGNAIGSHEEGVEVEITHCPGHIWDTLNLKLYFVPALRERAVFNDDGTPVLDADGNQITEEVIFGGMDSIWGNLQFNNKDKSVYDDIKKEFDKAA